jgi:uroporphyrinogen decarboxylase
MPEMNSISRFKYLINRQFKKLDRVLMDYWASPEIDKRLCKFFHLESREELLEHLDIDFRYIQGPSYIGPKLTVHPDGSEDDIWGVPRKIVHFGQGDHRGSYKKVVKFPLANAKTLQDVESYEHWPDPDWLDYEIIQEQCDAVHEKNRIAVFMGDRLNRIAQLKPVMYLRGIDKALSDLARKSTPIFDAILEKITSFYKEYLHRILKTAKGKIDLIVTGDDFGQQNGLLCSPTSWRNKLLPGFREFIQICKTYKIPVMHHTCGSVFPIIPDMIDAGLDILNPIQPGTANMDHSILKSEFGNDLIFHGGISLQGPLRFGTPLEVEEEVKTCCKTLGKDGGFIICSAHNLHPDMNTENIIALFNAYKKHCHY